MTEAGFFEPKRISPTGLTVVIALHAAGLAALVLAKAPSYVKPHYGKTTIIDIVLPKDPPPEKKPEVRQNQEPQDARPFARDPVIDRPPDVSIATQGEVIPILPPADPGTFERIVEPPAPDPVRVEAQFDPRFADQLRPPYPLSEVRNEVEGVVTLRLLIGADGRVKAAEKVAATNDAFFQAAQRQALRMWRFKPATVDGKPIESRKQMTLRFELDT
jgi:protein TonB